MDKKSSSIIYDRDIGMFPPLGDNFKNYFGEVNDMRLAYQRNAVEIDKLRKAFSDGDTRKVELILDNRLDNRYLRSKLYGKVNEITDIMKKNKETNMDDFTDLINSLGVDPDLPGGSRTGLNMSDKQSYDKIIEDVEEEENILYSREDIDPEEKVTIMKKFRKIKNYAVGKIRGYEIIDGIERDNEANSGKTLRERIRDLYKEHQKISIAFIISLTTLVIGAIISSITISLSGSSGGGGESDGGGGGDDKPTTTWEKIKKVLLWIVDKLFSMVGAIITFIMSLIKKAAAEIGVPMLIGWTAIAVSVVYTLLYGIKETAYKRFNNR